MTEAIEKSKASDKLAKRLEFLATLDESLDETAAALVEQIRNDRDRAEEVFLELLSLYNQGKNHPEDLRELNKAQELLHNTTEQLQKVFATLAKIKVGNARVQIAQINSQSEDNSMPTRVELIELIEQAEYETEDDTE